MTVSETIQTRVPGTRACSTTAGSTVAASHAPQIFFAVPNPGIPRRINRNAAPRVEPLQIKEKGMNIKGLSTNGLKLLYTTIASALAEDDALPANAKKYGVREYPDWRQQADAIEAELVSRKE